VEVAAHKIDIFGEANPDEYPLQPKRQTMEFLREKGQFRMRTNTFNAVFRIRHAVAFAIQPPIWVAAVIVGAFAIFHGHAHGTELPNAANPLTYSLGFVLATGLLHLSGIALGLLVRWPIGKIAVRVIGSIIALVGIGFLTGIV